MVLEIAIAEVIAFQHVGIASVPSNRLFLPAGTEASPLLFSTGVGLVWAVRTLPHPGPKALDSALDFRYS